MNKLGVLLVLFFSCFLAKSQIVIDNNPPYDNPTWLIDKYWDGKFNTKKVQQGAYYYSIEVLGEDKQIFKKSGEIKVIY